jgi:hypothetical protein
MKPLIKHDPRAGNCRFCRPVNVICYWGDLPQRAWKRPGLVVVAVLVALLIGLIAWVQASTMGLLELMVVAGFMLVCVVAISIALFGCDRCVARVWGRP